MWAPKAQDEAGLGVGGEAFPGFHDHREPGAVIEPKQSMDVLGHDHEAGDVDLALVREIAQNGDGNLPGAGRVEKLAPARATEGDEVGVGGAGMDERFHEGGL